jgi:hypothetical protein
MTKVWDSMYFIPWDGNPLNGYMSVSMFVLVYLEDGVATLYPYLNVSLNLDHPDLDRVWDSLMAVAGRHTHGEPTTYSDRWTRSSSSWSDLDPWKAHHMVEDGLCEALSTHGFKANKASPVVAPPVVTTAYVFEKLFLRLPHLMMRARTISESEIPADRNDMPRRGCCVPEQVLHHLDEDSALMGLAAWHRRRRRSFNKLLRALTRVRGVRCSWDDA